MTSPATAVPRRTPVRGEDRLERELRIVELLKAGNTRREVARQLDTNIDTVKRTAVAHGLSKNPNAGRKNATDGRLVKDQLAYCVRELGHDVVAELGADDVEGIELQRLYAALRVVLLDGETLIPRVQRVLEAQKRAALDAAADSRGVA